MEEITWKDVECLLSPDCLPELETWSKDAILAQMNRCATEFGRDFCLSHRSVLVSQLARKKVLIKKP